MGHSSIDPAFHDLRPWNEGRLIGAKRALRQQQVWAIRFWLDQHRRLRRRAFFDFAIHSKLRGCDVVRVRIGDLVPAVAYVTAPLWFSKRPKDRSSSS
jgi:hypothetical protein